MMNLRFRLVTMKEHNGEKDDHMLVPKSKGAPRTLPRCVVSQDASNYNAQ